MSVFLPIGNLQGGNGIDLPVTADLALWFDGADISTMWEGDDGTTPVTADGDPVGTWRDKIQGIDVNQTTPSARPTYETGILNGLSAVHGAGGTVDITNTLTSGMVQDSIFTFFCVANDEVNNEFGTVWMNSARDAGGRNAVWVDRRTQNRICELGTAIDDYLDLISRDNTSNFRMLSVVKNGVNAEAWKDGVSQDTSSAIDAGDTDNDRILLFAHGFGSLFRLTGHIAEVIIYEAALSTGDRQLMEAYLTDKWAL